MPMARISKRGRMFSDRWMIDSCGALGAAAGRSINGAIFLDAGFDAAAAAVKRIMGQRMSELPAADSLKDPKTRLQEILQANAMALPVYTLIAAVGEPHAQSFTVGCEVSALDLSTVGEGGSRRRAEQSAAAKLLQLLPPEVRRPT